MSTSSTRPWWQLGPLWLVPAIAFLATFGVFGVRRPGSVKAMLTNPQGLVLAAAAVVVVVTAIWASQFRPRIKPVLPWVATLGVLGAAFYAEVPFERSSTQNKTLIAEDVIDRGGTTAGAAVAATPMRSGEAAPAAAVRHATGPLQGIDHTASGTVSVIESASGQWVVRFENFDVQFTPTPVLYLVDRADVEDKTGTRIGAFGATDGTLLDVALPDGVEPGKGWTALIWCERFNTPIANATLA